MPTRPTKKTTAPRGSVRMGTESLSQAVRAALRLARRQVIVVASPGMLRAAFEHFLPLLRDTADRGVAVRVLTQVEYEAAEAVESLVQEGCHVRDLPEFEWPQRGLLVDSKRLLLFPLGGTSDELRIGRIAAVRVDDPRLLRAIALSYEELWQRALPAQKVLSRYRVRGKYASAGLR